MILLWSSAYSDNVCEKCENCGDECPYYLDDDKEELDYEYLNDIIKDDFDEKFKQNNYEYFVIGDSYTNNYGLHQNFCGGYSDLCGSVEEIIDDLSQGGCYECFKIYKGAYNSIIIKRIHHDGEEYYKLCRLSDLGQRYFDNGYDICLPKYAIKQTFKDFEFFW